MRLRSLPDKPLLDLILLALAFALLFGFGLGDRPYSAPSESRYIEIGREMAESGDFVTPRLDYVKYFEKPPLFYWIQAESTRLFGIGTFAARLPTLLFTILLCLLTYLLSRVMYGRLAGVLSTLALGTSLYIFAHSRIVLLDVPVSVFLTATLAGFIYAAGAPEGGKRRIAIYGMYVAAAGAVLTKGLIGAVLPGAVIFLWLLSTGRWSLLKQMRLVSGTLLFLALAAPWHILVAMRNPEWAWFYFIHEHWLRYFTPEAGRDKPIWFFFAIAVGGWFPWIVFFIQAKMHALNGFWQQRRENGRPLFLALWAGFIFIFYSLSHSKLASYIIPIFPPMSAMLGYYMADAWRQKSIPGFAAGFWSLIVLLLLFAVGPSIAQNVLDPEGKAATTLMQGGDELRYLSFVCMVSVVGLLVVFIQGMRRHVIITMLLVACVFLQMADAVGAHYNKDSMEPFAKIILSSASPNDEVAMYQVYYQDMPVYLGRRVTLADWKGELEFGSAHEDVSTWMMDAPTFWKRWMKDDQRIILIMRDDAFARLTKDKSAAELHLYPSRQDGRNLLILNEDPNAQRPAKPAPSTPAQGKMP